MAAGRKYLVLAAAFLALTITADAHAILLTASPGPNEIVHGPEVLVKLRFNSRIDGARSRLFLVSANGEIKRLPITQASLPNSIDARVDRLESGAYLVRWQVLAADGHISRGEIPFRVL